VTPSGISSMSVTVAVRRKSHTPSSVLKGSGSPSGPFQILDVSEEGSFLPAVKAPGRALVEITTNTDRRIAIKELREKVDKPEQ